MKKLGIIDPGHGGKDPGGSDYGYQEKDLALVIAKRVREILHQKGLEFDITRTADTELDSVTRTTLVRDKYEYCLSIHLNMGGGEGVEAIHSIYSEKGKELANEIAINIHKSLGIPIRRVFSREGSHGDYYYMHRLTGSTIAVIVECLFLDSEKDLQYLHIEGIAKAIAEGFIAFYTPKDTTTPIEPIKPFKTKVLKRGDRGDEVKTLQGLLKLMGYDPGIVDGIFGTGTHKALLAFQKLNGLMVDGIAGKQVYDYMKKLSDECTLMKSHRTMYQYGSCIHVYQQGDCERIDIDLGEYGRLEKLSQIVKDNIDRGKKVKCAVNAQFFSMDGSTEALGTLIDEGKYFKGPDDTFIDFLFYKDGTTDIRYLNGHDAPKLWELQRDTYFSIGTSWALMVNGKINLLNADKISHSKQRHPRTLLGTRKNGQFVLVTVDGRNSISRGVTAEESAKIMQLLGCYNAVNLDGGGSTEMVLVDNGKIDIVNNPSDRGRERSIGTAIIVYEK